MADNHYWYSWCVGGGTDKPMPTGVNAIGDYLTINSTDAAIPGTNAMNIVLNVLFMQIGPESELKAIELDLVSNKQGHHEFWACIDEQATADGPVNGHIFTTPIVIGHKYMRELKIRTNPLRCHFVLQDITAGTVETWDGNLTSTKAFTSIDDGIEWHNFDSAATFEPYWHTTVTQFGWSSNGGTSYTEFTPTGLSIRTGSDPAGNSSWPLGGLIVNGSSGTPDTGGDTGAAYNVADNPSATKNLYSGAITRVGEATRSSPNGLVGKTIKYVTVYLKRVGSPTGSVYCRARYDDDTIVSGCEAQIDASTISTAQASPYSFQFNSPQYNFPNDGGGWFIEFNGGNSSNYIAVDVTSADAYETTACQLATYSGTTYTYYATQDLCGVISTTAPGTGGGGGGGGGSTLGYGVANLGDIRFFYSGGEGNTAGDFSLGGGISSHEVVTYMLDALFSDISPGDATTGVKGDYRCIYMKNVSVDNTLTRLRLWFPTGGSISPDTLLQVALGTVNTIQPAIPNSKTSPSVKLTWATENQYTLAKPYELTVDLKPGEFIPIWLWRSARAASRPFSRDQALIEIDYWKKEPVPVTPGDGGGGEQTWTCPDGYTYNPVDNLCHLTSGGQGGGPLTTGHGVKLFYAPKAGGEKFELMRSNQSNINQVDFQSSVREFSGTQPNVAFKVSSQDQVRVEVGTSDTHGGFDDKSAIDNLDPVHLRTTGYMATNKDWRNYEAQWYLMVHSYSGSTSSGEAHMELEGRCGYNSTDSTSIGSPSRGRWCESTKYNANAYFTGRVKFEKCIEHTNGYSGSNPEKTGALSPAKWTGAWTGFKQVCYNIPGSTSVNNKGPKVKIELYADQGNNSGSTPSNSWKKVIEAIDDGSGSVFSGPRATYHCGGDDPKQPVTWGGPLLIFRWDHLDAEFKWLSVYELDPAIIPAGSASLPPTVPPIPGGGNTPPDTTPQGSAKVHYLYFAFGTDLGFSYDFITERTSAQLCNMMLCPQTDQLGIVVWTGGDAPSYTISNYCVTPTYITGTYNSGTTKDMVAQYWDDANGKCVAPGANSLSGSKTGKKGIISDGYGPKLTDSPKIFLIFWGQAWNTYADPPVSKAGVETRIRDYLLSRDVGYFSRLSQYGVSAPKWGGSCVNTTTPVPTSATVTWDKYEQAVHDSIQRGAVESPVVNSGNSIYLIFPPSSVTTLNSKADPSQTGHSAGYADYDYDSSSYVAGHHDASGGSTNLFRIISQQGPNSCRNLYTGSTTRFGYAVNANSIMLNQDPLTIIGFYLSKFGSPSGTVYYRIRKSDDSIIEFASLACTDITTTGTPELHLLRNEANDYVLQQGDKITCEYTGGSSSNYVKVDEMADNSNFEGLPTCSVSYTGTTYTQTTTKCPAGELWTGYALDATLPLGTGAGSTGSASPIPDTVILDVASANAPNHLGASQTYKRAGEVAATGSSVLVGQYITKVGAWLKRVGSPTGSVYARIYNAAGTLAVDFGAVDITTISTSAFQQVIWEKDDNYNIYAMASGDRIVVEYTGGDSSNYLNQDEANSDMVDGSDTIATRYSGSSWSTYSSKEACMKLWTSSGGTGGGGSPPPTPQPFSTVYDVPVTGSYHLSFSSSQRRHQQYINSSNSSLIGKVLTRVTFYINRYNRGSGTITCTIRDDNDNIVTTMGTVNITDVAGDGDNPVVFTNTANTAALQLNWSVNIERSQYDGDSCRGTSPGISNSYVRWYDGSGFGNSSDKDMCGIFEIGGV